MTLFSSRYMTQLLSIRVTRDLRQQYFEHIQSLPLSFYQEQNLGSLSSRAVGDAGQIASSLNSCLTNYLQTPFTLVSTLFACFYLLLAALAHYFSWASPHHPTGDFSHSASEEDHSPDPEKPRDLYVGPPRFSRRHSDR